MQSLCLVLCLLFPVFAQQDVVLSSTHPDIIYNPPLCNPTTTGCTSPWQVSNDVIPGTTIVYTDGPKPHAGNVIPQMFLNFRASALYLRTASGSNATVNFTLTAEPSDVSTTTEFNTSTGLIVAVNVPETQLTTLGVTFLPEDVPTRFGIESITLVVSNTSAIQSFLPSASLPHSSSPPTVSSTANLGASYHTGTIIDPILGSIFTAVSLLIAFLVI